MADRSSAARVAGTVIRKVTVGGTQFTLSQPDRVRKASDEEAVVCSRRRTPPPDRPDMVSAYMCGIAAPEEWQAYYRSLWLQAFRFWNALDPADRKEHAGTDGKTPAGLVQGVEWAYETLNGDDVTREELDHLWDAIRCVSQETSLGESSGSPGPEAIPKMEGPSTADQSPSTPG